MAKAKKVVTPITKAMRVKYAAPIGATALATAGVAVIVWVIESASSWVVPGTVQGAMTGLLSTALWYVMPLEWESN